MGGGVQASRELAISETRTFSDISLVETNDGPHVVSDTRSDCATTLLT